jgi:hypothetical protein
LSNGMLTLLQNTAIQFPVQPGIDAVTSIRNYEIKNWPNQVIGRILEADLLVGKYYRSIGRPIYRLGGDSGVTNPGADAEIETIKNTWRELEVLTQDLEHCFNVNSPFEANWPAYGIYYERIIYVACIGIEALFRKILEDNNVAAKATMNDFVKLKPHLRLDGYSVSLQQYPWLKPIAPFSDWNSDIPSGSLFWYNAYNLLKHEKRKNEDAASMKNAVYAAAAYYILAYATFGGKLFPGFFSDYFYFIFKAFPSWDMAQYYFESDDKSWAPINLNL